MNESRGRNRWLVRAFLACGLVPFLSCVSVASGQTADGLDAGAMAYVKALEDGRVEQIRTSRVVLGYAVDPASPPVEGAELFFTTDEGRTWIESILADPRANPVTFNADEDGLYGFSFVLHSARGSMARPIAGSIPQRWVMVDRSAPHIAMRNIQPPKPDASERTASVGWLVTDANNNLGQRPVTISYRLASSSLTDVRTIARGLEAEGEYHWTIPVNVSGEVVLRVEAEDRAGNRDYLETRSFPVKPATPAKTTVRVNQTVSLASVREEEEKSQASNSPVAKASDKSQTDHVVSAFELLNETSPDKNVVEKEAAERAKKEYDLGTWHRLRGEYDLAIRRYRDALAANPGLYQARNDLAGTLLALDRIDEAAREYKRILDSDKRYAPALEGLALVQIKRREYCSAHDTLERLLRERPNDPEAWLHFGDVCMFMGDRRGAREAWHTAEDCDKAVASLKSRAKRRLAIYQRDRLGTVD